MSMQCINLDRLEKTCELFILGNGNILAVSIGDVENVRRENYRIVLWFGGLT